MVSDFPNTRNEYRGFIMSVLNNWVKWVPLFPNDVRADFNSNYVGFKKRNVDGYNMGGCYMYAYDPTGEIVDSDPNHLDERVIYIGTAGSSKHRGICSRTLDFTGTIIRGFKQKNPYENGIYFRALFGEENKRNLYAAYFPMGYGEEIKIPSHNKEKELLDEYKECYGSLPKVDGHFSQATIALEHARCLAPKELEGLIEQCLKLLPKESLKRLYNSIGKLLKVS